MATEQLLGSVTLPVAADYSSTGQYLFMGIDSSSRAVLIASQGADAVGVLVNNPDAAGKAGTVAVAGITKVKAGATIAAGNKLTTGADGRAEVAATGDFVIGWSVSGGADGEIISMLFTHQDISA